MAEYKPSWHRFGRARAQSEYDADILPIFRCSWWMNEHGCPFCVKEYASEMRNPNPPGRQLMAHI